MFLKYLLIIFILLNTEALLFGQTFQNWGIKSGIIFSNQTYRNFPNLIISNFNAQIDTSIINFGGHYNRAGFYLEGYKEFIASQSINLQAGIGFRQRRFKGSGTRNLTNGLIEDLPKGEFNKNRFDNLFLDLGVKLRKQTTSEIDLYLLLSNRLDYLLGFQSEFWGNDYSYFTRFEYSPVIGAGVEIPIKGYSIYKISLEKDSIKKEVIRFTIEIEYNPGFMNVHRSGSIGGGGSTLASMPVDKIVYNQSFGIILGLRI